MTPTVQITFRNLKPSAAVSGRVQAEAMKLARYYPRIAKCRVLIEVPHRHRRLGEHFHVRIELCVPRAQLVVRHEPSAQRALVQNNATKWSKQLETGVPHKDVYVTIRDAFRSARRQIEDHARVLRGNVKTRAHPTAPGANELPVGEALA